MALVFNSSMQYEGDEEGGDECWVFFLVDRPVYLESRGEIRSNLNLLFRIISWQIRLVLEGENRERTTTAAADTLFS